MKKILFFSKYRFYNPSAAYRRHLPLHRGGFFFITKTVKILYKITVNSLFSVLSLNFV